MPSASPPIETKFKLTLVKYININAVITEIGMASPTIKVGLISFKKTNNIMTASKPPTIKLIKNRANRLVDILSLV